MTRRSFTVGRLTDHVGGLQDLLKIQMVEEEDGRRQWQEIFFFVVHSADDVRFQIKKRCAPPLGFLDLYEPLEKPARASTAIKSNPHRASKRVPPLRRVALAGSSMLSVRLQQPGFCLAVVKKVSQIRCFIRRHLVGYHDD